MPSNPLVPQGTLIRLRGSIVINTYPELNVTAAYLGRDGITLNFEGDSTLYIDTLTGAVTSTEPFIKITLDAHLLKTQNISDLYKTQMETLSTIGDVVVHGDAVTLSSYQLTNCSIQGVQALKFDGTDAGYRVRIGGLYYINNSAWDLI